jgi:peptidyl-prolyl cis-trans isomerase A (cyclophilin A)
MQRRFVVFAIPLVLALMAAARAPKRPATPLPDVVRVALTTEKGVITVELDAKRAPVTAANFVRYVDQRRFDGITFYRAMHLAWGTPPNGLIQAGQRDPRRLLPPIAHEPTNVTGLLHKAGALSMARNAPGTATADFSILLSDMPGLDADPVSTNPETKAGYAIFGYVIGGMDVVRAIWDAPRSPTLGEGVMKGQMLAPPVRVLTARRVAIPEPAAGNPAP